MKRSQCDPRHTRAWATASDKQSSVSAVGSHLLLHSCVPLCCVYYHWITRSKVDIPNSPQQATPRQGHSIASETESGNRKTTGISTCSWHEAPEVDFCILSSQMCQPHGVHSCHSSPHLSTADQSDQHAWCCCADCCVSCREVLTSRGMERWEIGDIASKIGQLYYNYYLRAAEIRFLHESYVFYEAIRSRAYFAQSATDPNLAIKQLRYFARFIIICLLLNRREVRQRTGRQQRMHLTATNCCC